MNSVLLDKEKHNRKAFDCEVKPLNIYLKQMANQQSNRDNTRTYILEDETTEERIIGFYTLTMMSIDLSALPLGLQKKHKNANSAGLIARLAVDKNFKQKGYGEWLLVDALKKLLNASEVVAFPLIVVDAKEGVSEFYEKFGFQRFQEAENRLFISIESVRKSFRARR